MVSRPTGTVNVRVVLAPFARAPMLQVTVALINNRFEVDGRWDVDRWGLPINQTDQAGTLGLFNSTLLLGGRVLGRWVGAEDSRAVMYLWKYVGWLLGVNEDWLFDTEREHNAFNYHMLLIQAGQTAAGGALAAAIVDGEGRLDHGRLNSLRAPYARARLLSMLRYFLGKEGMEDLCLPVALPWAVPPAVAKNLVASLLVARSERGRRYLEDADARFKRKRQRMLLEGAHEQVGPLSL